MNDCLSSSLVIGSFVAGALLASILFGIFSIVLWKLGLITTKGRIARRQSSLPCPDSTAGLEDGGQTPPSASPQQETTDIAPPGDRCIGRNASPPNAGDSLVGCSQLNPPKRVSVWIYDRQSDGVEEGSRESAGSESSEGSIVWENENGDFVLVGNLRRTNNACCQSNAKQIVTFRDKKKAVRGSACSSIVWENEIGDCVIVSNLRRQPTGNACPHCRPIHSQLSPSADNQPPSVTTKGRVSIFPPK